MDTVNLKEHLNLLKIKDIKGLIRQYNLHYKIKLSQKKPELISDLLKHFEDTINDNNMTSKKYEAALPKIEEPKPKAPRKPRIKKDKKEDNNPFIELSPEDNLKRLKEATNLKILKAEEDRKKKVQELQIFYDSIPKKIEELQKLMQPYLTAHNKIVKTLKDEHVESLIKMKSKKKAIPYLLQNYINNKLKLDERYIKSYDTIKKYDKKIDEYNDLLASVNF